MFRVLDYFGRLDGYCNVAQKDPDAKCLSSICTISEDVAKLKSLPNPFLESVLVVPQSACFSLPAHLPPADTA